jgi:hypothetical protein
MTTSATTVTAADIAFCKRFLAAVCGTPKNGALATLARATPTLCTIEEENDGIELGCYTIQKKPTTRRTIAGVVTGPVAFDVTTAQTVAARRDAPEDADLVKLGEARSLHAALLVVMSTELEQFAEGVLATWGEEEAAKEFRKLFV